MKLTVACGARSLSAGRWADAMSRSTITKASTAFVVAVALCACQAVPTSVEAERRGLQEASMNFDLADVQPFLVELSKQIPSGFSEQTARALAADIARLPIKKELQRKYVVKFEGADVPQFGILLGLIHRPAGITAAQ
jgi:hypothetical protein